MRGLIPQVALLLAILLEAIGTSALQASAQFTRLGPTLLMAVCYIASFYLLSIVLKTIPVGIAYAVWSGLGIVLIAIVGYYRFGQALDTPAILGIGLIISGVLVVNLFSDAVTH